MRQPQGAVAGDRPLAVQDSGDPVGRHLELPAKLGSAHAEFLELFGEMLAWMDSGACHALFPWWWSTIATLIGPRRDPGKQSGHSK